MALLTYADRVAETTTTTGTGTIQLGGAVDGKFRTFVAGAGSGNTVPYVVVHRTANEWEVGYGVVTSGSPDTLTRAGVYSSSNGGSAVTFSAGTKDVFLGLPAGKTVTFDDTTGSVTISGTVTATTLGGTLSTAAQPNVTSVGTLSSLTVSGNLTVDTDTLFVDAANNRVGVGTATPAYPLQVRRAGGAGSLGVGIDNAVSARTVQYFSIGDSTSDTTAHAWYTRAGTATDVLRMSVDYLGNLAVDTNTLFVDAANNRVGIGTASPDVTLDVEAAVGTSTSLAMLKNTSAANANNIAQMQFWVGNSFGGLEQIASIHGINPNAGANNGGTLVFSTSSNGTATTPTERARITAGGYFKASNDGTYVGSTGTYHELRSTSGNSVAVAVSHAAATANQQYGLQMILAGDPNNTTNWFFEGLGNATSRFVVYSSGTVQNSTGVYGTISDAKLKQDVVDAGSQWDDVKAIRFRKYRFKSDVEAKGEDAPYLLGVVAQELRETSPGLVDAHPDTEQVEVEVEVEKTRPVIHEVEEVVTDAEGVESVVTKSVPMLDADGQPVTETYTETETRTETRPTGTQTLSVKQSILLMKAAVALQEAMARIETLEARLAALEAK